MLETIERLYDEIHGPKITPYELIDNVKLSNYISVDFSKDEDSNIIAYTKCLLEDGNNAIFIYVFNKDNKLMSLKSSVRGFEEEVYNRKSEIKKFYLLVTQSLKPSVKAI